MSYRIYQTAMSIGILGFLWNIAAAVLSIFGLHLPQIDPGTP
jgi:hypothetical protein